MMNGITTFWPEWTIEEEIGQGAYGTVYKAVRHEFGRDFLSAIKVMSIPAEQADVRHLQAEGMERIDIITYFGEIVTDCINEIAILERLKGNSHIVSVEDFKVIEHKDVVRWDIYIRMELLTSLEDYIAEKGFLPREQVIQLGLDICDALKQCEKEKIIHRDIKIENVFVSRHGDFKLGDFGIAKNLEKTTMMLSRKGTQGYMAPEVWKGEEYKANVDIYSLGLLMYLLSNNNRMPFLDTTKPFNNYAERNEAFIRRIRGEVIPPPCNADSALASVILRACSYNPGERFQTATAFEEELKRLKRESLRKEKSLEENTNIEIPDIKEIKDNDLEKSKTNVVADKENAEVDEATSDATFDFSNYIPNDAKAKKYEALNRDSKKQSSNKKKNVKVLFSVLGVVIVLLLISYFYLSSENTLTNSTEDTEDNWEPVLDETDSTYNKQAYTSVLTQYRNEFEPSGEDIREWSEIYEHNVSEYKFDSWCIDYNLLYIEYDIDKDGINELLIGMDTPVNSEKLNIFAVYSVAAIYSNEATKLIENSIFEHLDVFEEQIGHGSGLTHWDMSKIVHNRGKNASVELESVGREEHNSEEGVFYQTHDWQIIKSVTVEFPYLNK